MLFLQVFVLYYLGKSNSIQIIKHAVMISGSEFPCDQLAIYVPRGLGSPRALCCDQLSLVVLGQGAYDLSKSFALWT